MTEGGVEVVLVGKKMQKTRKSSPRFLFFHPRPHLLLCCWRRFRTFFCFLSAKFMNFLHISSVLQVLPLAFPKFTPRSSRGLMGKYWWPYVSLEDVWMCSHLIWRLNHNFCFSPVDCVWQSDNGRWTPACVCCPPWLSTKQPVKLPFLGLPVCAESVCSHVCVFVLSGQRWKLPAWLNVIYLSLVRQARSRLS